MLTNYWLLADLDGTLVSTPHKANGRYLSIARSPCFEQITSWLNNGGNVCVITTADMRTIDQVYRPLRSFLKTHKEYMSEASAEGPLPAGSDDAAAHPPRRGCLLLSLYTGAVLYWCTFDSIIILQGYSNAVHCATRESAELAAAHRLSMEKQTFLVDGSHTLLRTEPEVCVRGTCFDEATALRLQTRVESIYLEYLRDVLLNKDPAVREAMKHLSHRYKRLWGGLLQYLEFMHNVVVKKHMGLTFSLGALSADASSPLGQETSTDPAAVEWKVEYMRSRRGFMTALGILRVEHVQSHLCDGELDANRIQCPLLENMDGQSKAAERAQLISHAAHLLQAALPSTAASQLVTATEAFSAFVVDLLQPNIRHLQRQMKEEALLLETKEASPRSQTSKEASEAMASIAQVIVLGLPLSLFSKYFRPHVGEMVRAGVSAMPQPNSVVFSKMGVSKSTTLRYLLGRDRVATVSEDAKLHSSNVASTPTTHPACRGENFAGCVRSHHGVAVGDNPQSTDFELTVFRDVPFISVEKEIQRVERHRRILRRLKRAQLIESRGGYPSMPDGSPAPSYAELVSSLRRSGPMMDDRLFQNIHFVGGEEEGTALFLAALLRYASAEQKKVPGAFISAQFLHTVRKAQESSRDALAIRTVLAKL